ncbi:MAG: holin family protein [Pseudomonadota bacterium]
MGVIGKILGQAGTVTALADAATGVAEVFTPSATKRMELSAAAQMAALNQLGQEYGQANAGWFDSLVDGLNRLPRPLLAFGTIGMFVYAMVDPPQFAQRMVGLNAVPEPLWWLLGAVVAFYFGARETFYFRNRAGTGAPPLPATPAQDAENPALGDWRRGE